MVNVENCQFLNGNCEFFSLSEMKTVSSITLPYSSTFNSLFLSFFVLEIFKFKYVSLQVCMYFSSDILLPFLNLNDLNSRDHETND